MSSAAGAAAAAAARIRAIKASGAIVRLAPEEFLKLLGHNADALVVHSPAGFFSSHKYLTSYQGLAFYTYTPDAMDLPSTCDIVEADKIWVPD